MSVVTAYADRMNMLLAMLVVLSGPVVAADVAISGTTLVQGFEPSIAISGLVPGERVRIHSLRMFAVWREKPGKGWQPVPKAIHAWADYRADAVGRVDLKKMSPLAGTFSGNDPYGILWSGHPVSNKDNDPYLPRGIDPNTLAEGKSRILVSRDGDVLAMLELGTASPPGLNVLEVSDGRLNGTFAAPSDGRRHPVVILLHGSEGGSRDGALQLARRFAGQGYAAFAFNYFAWDLAGIEGIPNAHANQPIEMITKLRDWLARRPEADVERLGVYGHSKGAEYAALAATRLPWIDAVAACVPTDVIWQGYGIGDGRNRSNSKAKEPELYSSFSWKGRPLPYVDLKGDRKPFHSNSEFYKSKRAAMGKKAFSAEIPVEKARATFLWLGAGRDEVWASGEMAKKLDAKMKAAGKVNKTELVVYERAGHAICGDGTYPTRVWQDESSDPRDPDLDETGRAASNSWSRIKVFFSQKLR